jgi:hypothetical protein
MRSTSAFAVAAALLSIASEPAAAGEGSSVRYAERDCKPVNGPFGYYANPWCHEWDSVSGHTWSLERGPDGSVRVERSYRQPQRRRDLR